MSSQSEFILSHVPDFARRICENPGDGASALQRLVMSHRTAFAAKDDGNFPGLLRTALEVLTLRGVIPPVKVAIGYEKYCKAGSEVRELEDAVFLAYAWDGDAAAMIAAGYEAADRGRLSVASFLFRCAGATLLEDGRFATTFFLEAALALFAAVRIYDLTECAEIVMQLLESVPKGE